MAQAIEAEPRAAIETAVHDAWHVIGLADSVTAQPSFTMLLGTQVCSQRLSDATITVWAATVGKLPVREHFGYVWTSLGNPVTEPFTIPEMNEPNRRIVHRGGLGVHVSAPRAVENFLDLAHLPFIHTGTLGIEPFTEIAPYDVVVSDTDGIVATRCRIFQPKAAQSASDGFTVDYVFRVPHPFAAVLLKANQTDPDRMDVICMLIQALDEEHIVAHQFACLIDHVNADTDIRAFGQAIFAQDKPILENQRPRRLPLDLRSELPVRADALSVAYRRWLKDLGVRYGTTAV
jgi:phenylpropionate dioxygenase-like ring-hydroxylating dioxygenase large terminal subunit